MTFRPSARAGKRAAVVGAALALIGTAVVTGGPGGTSASSHREAPLIAGDPRADNTDVYAFVSPDDPDSVTLISNWLPFSEPNGGPNFYPFAEDTLYNIKIDNDGDALEDLVYTWVFTTTFDPTTFLPNDGPVTSLDDPNLLYYQTYDLTETRFVDGVQVSAVTLLDDVRAAPSLSAPHRSRTTRRSSSRRPSTCSEAKARRTPAKPTTRSSLTCASSTSSTVPICPRGVKTPSRATTSIPSRSRFPRRSWLPEGLQT
jgi:hypothetical protein